MPAAASLTWHHFTPSAKTSRGHSWWLAVPSFLHPWCSTRLSKDVFNVTLGENKDNSHDQMCVMTCSLGHGHDRWYGWCCSLASVVGLSLPNFPCMWWSHTGQINSSYRTNSHSNSEVSIFRRQTLGLKAAWWWWGGARLENCSSCGR